MTHDELKALTDEQLEAMLGELEVEKAPASLSSRLNRIPEEEGSRGWAGLKRRFSSLFDNPAPRWVMAPAMAAVAVAVLAAVLMQDPGPSAAEVEKARQDLAIAFSYLDRAGVRTGAEIQGILGSELRHSVKQPLSEHMPFTEQFRKEETT